MIIRKLAQWNLHSYLSLAPSSFFSQSHLPHKLFSATFLIGFGKHLIAAVTPLHLHTVCTLLFPINEHIDLSSARCISFSWNFWSACLSQKKDWLDEKCVPGLWWYFMCKRLICHDSHQLAHLETQQCPEQPHIPTWKMPVNTEHHPSPWGIKQQKTQLWSLVGYSRIGFSSGLKAEGLGVSRKGRRSTGREVQTG